MAGSSFKGLQIRDQVSNLSHVQLKLRHGRMGRYDTLGKRLREILDRIAEMKRAEWRCVSKRTFSDRANCMTWGAVGLGEGASALDPLFLGLRCGCQKAGTDEGRQHC
jgi:hypothetical protein